MVDSISSTGSSMVWSLQSRFNTTTLTDEEKNTLSEILSRYDSSDLTSESARSIMDEIREAGIKPCRDLENTAKTAGFDLAKFRSQKPGGGMPPGGGMGMGGGRKINTEGLEKLQTILSQYDLANLDSEDEESLFSQLNEAGFMKQGLMVDVAL